MKIKKTIKPKENVTFNEWAAYIKEMNCINYPKK